jgi:hypothetical protein
VAALAGSRGAKRGFGKESDGPSRGLRSWME